MLDYFEGNGARKFNEAENPAEYILDVVAGSEGQNKDWASIWEESHMKKEVETELSALIKEPPQFASTGKPREFATSTWYQFCEVYKRLNIVFWRNPEYNAGRVFQGLMIGLAVGFSFWNIGTSSSDINLYIFSVFFLLMLAINMVSTTQTQFMVMRDLFKRDYASKYYSTIPFAVSMVLVELPYLVIIASGTFFTLYWSTGIDSNALSGFYMWLMVVMVLFFGVSFGQAIASGVPNMMVAFVFLPFIDTFLFLFNGLLISYPAMPTFWRSWMYHVNPLRYFLEGTLTTVLYPVQIECTRNDWLRFDIPEGETCGSYMKEFFEAGGKGKIENTEDTEQCSYCTYQSGVEFYTPLTWDIGNRWRNFGILTCFWLFNIIISIVLIYLNRKQKR